MYYKIITNTGIVIKCKNVSHCKVIIETFDLWDFHVIKVYPACTTHDYYEYGLPIYETRSFDKYLLSRGCKLSDYRKKGFGCNE